MMAGRKEFFWAVMLDSGEVVLMDFAGAVKWVVKKVV